MLWHSWARAHGLWQIAGFSENTKAPSTHGGERHDKACQIVWTRAVPQTCTCVHSSQVHCAGAKLKTQFAYTKKIACHAMDCEASRYPTFPLIHSVSSMSKKSNLVLTSGCIQMCRVSPCPCRLHSLLTNNCLKKVWTGCLRQWFNGYLSAILIKSHLFANGSLCLKSLKPMDYTGQRPQINSMEGRKEIIVPDSSWSSFEMKRLGVTQLQRHDLLCR